MVSGFARIDVLKSRHALQLKKLLLLIFVFSWRCVKVSKGKTFKEPPETYSGDELFQMINGGADIYHEYGFVQVVRAAYTDGKRLTIKLEI